MRPHSQMSEVLGKGGAPTEEKARGKIEAEKFLTPRRRPSESRSGTGGRECETFEEK